MTTKKKTPDAKQGAKAGPAAVPLSEAYVAAVKEFESALDLLHRNDFAAAAAKFRAVAASNKDEVVLAGRARTFAMICERRMTPPISTPKTRDEYYHYGVLMANDGKYDEALASLDCAIAESPDAAGYYARAAVRGLQGKAEAAAADLRKAIEQDLRLRFQAANDPDFDAVRDEAVFIDVIEPTPAGA